MIDERNRLFREMKSYRFLKINEKSFVCFFTTNVPKDFDKR